MSKLYKIAKITYATDETKERMDGRYPLRKGSYIRLRHLQVGDSMMYEYVKAADGKPKTGYLTTSPVDSFSCANRLLKVTTFRSIYYLKELDEC